ncbi:Protein phosphatase 1 regulatory subunit 3C-B [Trichinella nativa]|uniref:Protein phosphatase 1 regulatory subunit 3C-B n=1 Tax=Trichinella nativa TaxID=6335 RepID=A0A0V1KXY6_9BILA|nr:Protein phosphatase 1 regulatory subunit 3C-B [Trichinella nativa]
MSMDNGSVLLKSPITMDPSQALRNLNDRSLSESEKINLMLAREGKVEIDDWRMRWAELMAASGLAPSAENKNPNNTNGSNKSNNKKKKKKVTFADCQGHQLATVKVMSEPSDVPPRLSASILRAHGIPVSEDDEENMADGGKSAAQIPASWHLGFTQPASQYAAFRRKTNEQQVALENVMLDDRCSKLTGTVKVKNISFEKTVLIRYTTDNWQSYYDKQATFQRSAGDLDTFQFQFNMPANEPASIHPHDTVQFCVCYKTGDADLDDVDGAKHSDAFLLNISHWGEFASWQHLCDDRPYW